MCGRVVDYGHTGQKRCFTKDVQKAVQATDVQSAAATENLPDRYKLQHPFALFTHISKFNKLSPDIKVY